MNKILISPNNSKNIKLPENPGVYLFFNKENKLIYVGKASSLRSRVQSYFSGRNKSDRPIETLISEVKKIDYQITDSILEAIILEASLIKKHQPLYNVLGKDDKSWNYLVITKEEYPTIKTVREHDLRELEKKVDLKTKFIQIFGPFPGLNNRAILKILRQIFNYRTCEPNSGKACFYRQIEQCFGVCEGAISVKDYQQKVIKPLLQFLSGKKKSVLKIFEKNMNQSASKNEFEEAKIWRNQLFHLQKIQDLTLLNKSFFEIENFAPSKIKTIEGYDISNFGNSGLVGAMVFFQNGHPDKKKYRKFKIKSVPKQNDIACLKEVFSRRLKKDWPLPDLFLIDGGKPQINCISKILKNLSIKIPVISIAKGPSRKNENFFTTDEGLKAWIKENKKTIISVRDEAHRFAITFQKQTRKIKF